MMTVPIALIVNVPVNCDGLEGRLSLDLLRSRGDEHADAVAGEVFSAAQHDGAVRAVWGELSILVASLEGRGLGKAHVVPVGVWFGDALLTLPGGA
jgi:hypothetical protein